MDIEILQFFKRIFINLKINIVKCNLKKIYVHDK
jgi:hypothetical protein